MKESPSMDLWLREAKMLENADKIGMYLTHNGVVRATPKRQVRECVCDGRMVAGMRFSCDQDRLDAAIEDACSMPGIYHVRVWINEGILQVGDDLMYLLIGGDIRPHVTAALDTLLDRIKGECVHEEEIYREDEA